MTVEKIIGIGTYLPGPQIDNETLAQLFHINREWIDFFIGTKTRHFAFDLETKQPRYQLSDICSYAAQQAIENSEIDLKEIQAVILATATPDYLMPTSVNLIADQLGLNNIATYQLQSGCAGAIQAIDLGTQLLKSGRVNNVLVIGGDVCNKFLNLNRDFTQMNSKELVN
jgi:3-oxoacyl-[acyl-carrier-protein] synthase-3